MFFSSTDTSQDFDPEAFLETLSNLKQEEPPYRNPSPPDTPLLHVCPIHTQEVLDKRETDTQWGHWEYFRCPVQGCFVCCGAPQIDSNLNAATQQLQDFYRRLPLEKMKCYCSNNLNLCLSNSERNPGRLFFKCSKRECDFFHWANEYPKGKIRLWLEGEKFIYMFDGKIVKRKPQEVLFEPPLQKRAREIVNKHMGPPDTTPKERLYLEKRRLVGSLRG